MKFWQTLTWVETDQITRVAEIAEEVGFHGVLMSDHALVPRQMKSRYPYSEDGKPSFSAVSEYPDIWVLLGAIAAGTQRLRLSTSVFVLPLRNPIEVAKSAASLAIVSQGRFSLGVGVGWGEDQYDAFGVEFSSRGRRADEGIEVMRKLWSTPRHSDWVEHQGEFFSFPPLRQCPVPRAPIPIWVGGHSRAARRRAARLGDGFIGSGNAPEEVAPLLEEIGILRRECGREREPFETVIGLTTPPDLDTFRRLEACGMTSGVSYPLRYALGERSSIDEKRRVMEAFAESIILPMRGG